MFRQEVHRSTAASSFAMKTFPYPILPA
jgi:hypothetical protein